jgi:UDP-N-acetylglucosamine diphosphorylase/glucosamine-1-phosphate N-acetyltransferase
MSRRPSQRPTSSPGRRRVAVVLAAGKGTRMRSERPKVLHEAAGRPLLAWVLDVARAAGCDRLLVIVGHKSDEVRQAFAGADDVTWVLQERQLGTGHALQQVEGALDLTDDGDDPLLLVLSGDAPLVTPPTLERLSAAVEAGAWGAMAVSVLDEPGSLGRVVPDAADPGRLARIVEAADASPEELAVRTVNAGLYALPAAGIVPYLNSLAPDNAKGELYLTDALVAAATDGHTVRLVALDDPAEAFGVNTPAELERASRLLTERRG